MNRQVVINLHKNKHWMWNQRFGQYLKVLDRVAIPPGYSVAETQGAQVQLYGIRAAAAAWHRDVGSLHRNAQLQDCPWLVLTLHQYSICKLPFTSTLLFAGQILGYNFSSSFMTVTCSYLVDLAHAWLENLPLVYALN